MSELRRSVVLLGAAGLLLLLAPASAHASSNPISINLGRGWVHDSPTPLFNDNRIVPGWRSAKTLQIRNNTDASMILGITAAGIVENENGCTHAEAVVDRTCGTGPDQGELGHYLIFTVSLDPTNTGTYASAPAWTGTLYDMRQPAVLSSSVPAHSVWAARITSELPMATGNEVQTDSVDFSLHLDAEGLGSTNLTTVVGGEKFTKDLGAGSGSHISSVLGDTFSKGTLPFTGSYVGVLLPLGVTLVLGGGLLRFLAIRRRARADLG